MSTGEWWRLHAGKCVNRIERNPENSGHAAAAARDEWGPAREQGPSRSDRRPPGATGSSTKIFFIRDTT